MARVVGVLTARLYIPEAMSLKDKRQVLKSLLARTSDRFNVSVAEVGRNDSHTSALIAVVTVANEHAHVDSVLAAVLQFLLADPRAVVEEHSVEII